MLLRGSGSTGGAKATKAPPVHDPRPHPQPGVEAEERLAIPRAEDGRRARPCGGGRTLGPAAAPRGLTRSRLAGALARPAVPASSRQATVVVAAGNGNGNGNGADAPARPAYVPNSIDDPNYVRIFDTTLRDGEQSP
eukprot:jgi/Tetstr1/461113/TSEL_006252.t1